MTPPVGSTTATRRFGFPSRAANRKPYERPNGKTNGSSPSRTFLATRFESTLPGLQGQGSVSLTRLPANLKNMIRTSNMNSSMHSDSGGFTQSSVGSDSMRQYNRSIEEENINPKARIANTENTSSSVNSSGNRSLEEPKPKVNKTTNSVEIEEVDAGEDEPGMPTRAQWKIIVREYLEGLHERKREKALISRKLHEMIYDTLMHPESTRLGSPQFRFWARKMFELVEVAGSTVITHGGRPVAVKEHIYDILCMCHLESNHAGRDKTCKVLREYYTWIPKELTANFVKACPTCAVKRAGDPSFVITQVSAGVSTSAASTGGFSLCPPTLRMENRDLSAERSSFLSGLLSTGPNDHMHIKERSISSVSSVAASDKLLPEYQSFANGLMPWNDAPITSTPAPTSKMSVMARRTPYAFEGASNLELRLPDNLVNYQYEDESASQDQIYFLRNDSLNNYSVSNHENHHQQQQQQPYHPDEGDMQQHMSLPPLMQYLSEVAPTAALAMRGNMNLNTLPRLRLPQTSFGPNVPIDPLLLAEEKPEDKYMSRTAGSVPCSESGASGMPFDAGDDHINSSMRTYQGNAQAPKSIDLTKTNRMAKGWDFEDPGLSSTTSTCASIEANNLQTPLEVPLFLTHCNVDESTTQAEGDGEFSSLDDDNLIKMENSEYPTFD